MGEESALEYKNMELEEGRSRRWREDTSVKDIKSTHSRCWRSNVCSIICVTLPLFLILMIMVSLKSNQQDSMLRELETKADNMASALHSLQSNLQQTAPHSQQPDFKELTEVKSAVTNLGASITSLSSKLQASQQGTKMQELETAVKNMSSTLDSVASKMQETDEKLMTMLTNLTAEIMSTKRSKDEIKYSCTENWKLHETRCYLFSSDTLTWQKARDYCKTQRATLLVINDRDEWEFITTKPVSLYWLGLSEDITGQWKWVDGTPHVMDKSQWEVGQPDDWTEHGLGGGEDCANFSYNNRLNDDHCSRENKYICERTATAD